MRIVDATETGKCTGDGGTVEAGNCKFGATGNLPRFFMVQYESGCEGAGGGHAPRTTEAHFKQNGRWQFGNPSSSAGGNFHSASGGARACTDAGYIFNDFGGPPNSNPAVWDTQVHGSVTGIKFWSDYNSKRCSNLRLYGSPTLPTNTGDISSWTEIGGFKYESGDACGYYEFDLGHLTGQTSARTCQCKTDYTNPLQLTDSFGTSYKYCELAKSIPMQGSALPSSFTCSGSYRNAWVNDRANMFDGSLATRWKVDGYNSKPVGELTWSTLQTQPTTIVYCVGAYGVYPSTSSKGKVEIKYRTPSGEWKQGVGCTGEKSNTMSPVGYTCFPKVCYITEPYTALKLDASGSATREPGMGIYEIFNTGTNAELDDLVAHLNVGSGKYGGSLGGSSARPCKPMSASGAGYPAGTARWAKWDNMPSWLHSNPQRYDGDYQVCERRGNYANKAW